MTVKECLIGQIPSARKESLFEIAYLYLKVIFDSWREEFCWIRAGISFKKSFEEPQIVSQTSAVASLELSKIDVNGMFNNVLNFLE